jgi:PAS domain S-box-containing protein
MRRLLSAFSKYSMKKMLMFLIVVLLLIFIYSISTLIYFETKNQINKNFDLTLNQTESYLTIGSERITRGQMLWEATYEKPISLVMNDTLKEYSNVSGDLSQFNVNTILNGINPDYRNRIDILFINASGMVDYSTDPYSKGVNFSEWAPFYKKITDMRMNDSFVLDRAVRGFNTDTPFRIFGYHPTPDHKYLVEIIYRIYDDYESQHKEHSINTLIEELKNKDSDLMSLDLIGSTGALMSTPDERPLPIDNGTRSIAEQVYLTENPRVFYDPLNHTLTKYFFIESGDNTSPSSDFMDNIGKLVYSTRSVDQELSYYLIIYLLTLGISTIIILLVAYWISGLFFSPVDTLIEDLDKIAKGDIRHKIRPSCHPEIDRIVSATSSMVQSILDLVEHLERSENRYYTLFSNSSDAVVLWNGKEVVDANPAAKNLFGWNNSDNINEYPVVSDDEHCRIVAYLIDSCKGISHNCNVSIELSDKKEHILEIKIVRILLENTSLEMLHIVDITEETRMNNEIHRLADIFRNTHAGIIAGPLDHPNLVNEAYNNMHGFSEDTALKEGFFGPVHQDSKHKIDLWINEARERGHISVEALRVRSDGTTFPALHDLTIINISNGNYYLIANLQDISAQKKIWELTIEKNSLFEAGNLLRTILDYLPDPTFAIDLNGKVISWNRAIQTMTGLSSSDIIGKGEYAYSEYMYKTKQPVLIDIVINPVTLDKNRYLNLHQDGDLYSADIKIENCLNGEHYYWVVAGPVYDAKGRCIGAIESIRDITTLKQGEKALKDLNDKLVLLSSITRHDIRNKVLIIDGYRALALEECTENEVKELLSLQGQAVEDIGKQIEFSREYQDIGMQNPSWNSVKSMFDHTVSRLNDNVDVITDIPDLEIYCDNLVEKVFYNLIDNSIRHGKNLATIKLSWIQNEDEGFLIYEDNGVGIPDDEKENIFLKGYGKNTGLGLFLIREILGITGISIIENGTPGEGVRFEIRIPKGRYRIKY